MAKKRIVLPDYTQSVPELPEVEAVCRRLRESVLGAAIVNARVLRPSVSRPQSASRVERHARDARIERVTRRGKHILIHLSNAHVLHVHLRMTGNLYAIPDVRFRSVTVRAYFELSDGRALVFDDSRVLGKIHARTVKELDTLLDGVGPEPSQMTGAEFAAVAKRARKPIKTFLLDQKRISGLGNIYAAEALFRAKIHPARLASGLSDARLKNLHQACVDVLAEAMESSYAAYAQPGQFSEGESFPVAVYDREGEPCHVCVTPIRRIPQAGRSTYFCSKCQRA